MDYALCKLMPLQTPRLPAIQPRPVSCPHRARPSGWVVGYFGECVGSPPGNASVSSAWEAAKMGELPGTQSICGENSPLPGIAVPCVKISFLL
jgi:hypothetical protein